MTKVPVVLLDIAHICSPKHPQVVMGTQELPCAGTALQTSTDLHGKWSYTHASVT